MATQIDVKAKAIQLFSQLSNINFGYSAPTEQDLVDNFNRVKDILHNSSNNIVISKIQELWNCNWEVVWGPALYTSLNEPWVLPLPPEDRGKYHADNSMYVVKGYDATTERNVYVIAVAGTNSLSTYELKCEDIDVKTTQNWDDNTAHGVIATGSMTGLNKVLGLVDPKQKLNLMDFFKAQQQTGKNMEIITCGHSLGGALSPLVALRLKEWSDVNNYAIPISTYPTAGPTTGDASFAQYAENTLGADNYHSLINTNDIVPMAWEQETFLKIPQVYDNNDFNQIKPPSWLNPLFIKPYAKATKNIHYTRIAKGMEQSYAGKPGTPCKEGDNDCTPFMNEVMTQHIGNYLTEGFGFSQDSSEAVATLLKSGRKQINIYRFCDLSANIVVKIQRR